MVASTMPMLRSSSHPRRPKAMAEPMVLEKEPVAYWTPHCAFRGLDQSGSINDLQIRLREAKSELNKETKKSYKAVRDDFYNSLKAAEQKANSHSQEY